MTYDVCHIVLCVGKQSGKQDSVKTRVFDSQPKFTPNVSALEQPAS